MSDPSGAPKSVRSDARLNHKLLVATAREVFAERGIEAALDEIARRAGLGIATLYRHFPTREALVEAIFAERADEFRAISEAALAEPDAWAGLVGFLEAILALQSGDRLLREIFLHHPPHEARLTETRLELSRLFDQVLTRAHEQGALRSDFSISDLVLMVWSFAPVIDATGAIEPNAWRRHLHWLLDGLRPRSATHQTQPPLTESQLGEAMLALRQHRSPPRPGPPRRDPSAK